MKNDTQVQASQHMHSEACSCEFPGRRRFIKAGLLAGTGLMLSHETVRANSVQRLSGRVFVNRRYAAEGTPVGSGDIVTVAYGGSASFTIGDDAYLLRGGTSLKIEGENHAMVSILRLFTGALLGVFGDGEKLIATRAATIGIRGTGIFLDTAPDRTYFCTCYGQTELNVSGLERRVIRTDYHKASMIETPRHGRNEIHDMAGFEYHSDDELRAAEALQGRKVPFDQG